MCVNKSKIYFFLFWVTNLTIEGFSTFFVEKKAPYCIEQYSKHPPPITHKTKISTE